MRLRLYLLLSVLFLFVSCDQFPEDETFDPKYFAINIPKYFPNSLNIPEDNLMSEAAVELGRYLFYDVRLTGYLEEDKQMSCASCHVQKYAFESGMDNKYYLDGRMRGILDSTITPHSMLPLINLVFQSIAYTWNGGVEPRPLDPEDAKNIEYIVKATLTDRNEMAGNLDTIQKRIASIAMYSPLFKKAFNSEAVTIDLICKAIAQFVRTLISSNSRFDKYLRGELVLTDEEMKGYILFTTEEGADCFHCHGGSGNVLFSTYDCLNNGLDPEDKYIDPYDRYFVTKLIKDKGSYRVPTLRNIEYTAPYMHDGRFTTLEEVIDQYSESVHYSPNISPLMHHVEEGGVQLTDYEKECLKAFLLSLSDEEFTTNPKFSCPDYP